MQIVESHTGRKIDCFISLANKTDLPKKKAGWSFNWLLALIDSESDVYVLSETSNNRIHGCLQLKNEDGMLIMNMLELAPFNIGANREFERVAGCLIAFACREAIKIESNYKGYLTFVSKTKLIYWYKVHYYATQTIGQRMYIDPFSGTKLINEYLK